MSNSLIFLSSCFSKFLSLPGLATQWPNAEFIGLRDEREIKLFSNLLSSVLKYKSWLHGINIVFALIVPEKEDNLHIDLLSNIASMLEDKSFLLDIRNSTSKEEIKRHIQKFSH